ncbi:hypothetical protein ACQ4PT_069217 [Festuca glaucescens]
MACYPCDPIPHLPPGADIIPVSPLQPQRGYVCIGGTMHVICDDWAIGLLEPEPSWELFQGTANLITGQLEGRGYGIKQISRCAMGAAMVRFQDCMARDNAVKNSPYIVQDTVMRVIEHDKGRNFRAANFTHDVWIMPLNYPPGCWYLDTVVATFAPYGRFLIWNRDESNKARILAKIRAYDVDKIPGSIVVLQNFSEEGHGGCWSYPCILMNRTMIRAAGGDEDPLPPDGQNPHPTPIIIDDFAAWHAHNEGPPMAHAQNAAEANVPHAPAPHAAPAAPVENEEPVVHTPAQSPAHHAKANVALVAGDAAVDEDFIMEPVDMVEPTDDAMEPSHDSMIGSEVHTDNMLQNDSSVAVPDADPMSAVRNMIGNVAKSVNTLLPLLSGSNVLSASCKLVDVDSPSGIKRKCYLQINTFHDVPQTSSNSSVRIVELQDEEVQPRNVRKKKEKPPVNVSKVGRSGRIAKLNAGYKDGKPEDGEPENESGVDPGPVFEALVLDDTAPPPPHLPMSTLQALGTGPCQMHPSDVSDDSLNYDSTNDSIE